MSAQLIEFPNPAAPDAEAVRELLAFLRRTGAHIPSDPCIGPLHVWSECQRRGLKEPSTGTVYAELAREKEAEEWLPADVIEFPTEMAEVPLRTLRAVWRYTTARAAWYRALKAGLPTPDSVSRPMANEYGDAMRKPGKRQAEQLIVDIEAAEEFIRKAESPRYEALETYITVTSMGGREVSRGLQLVGRAIRARKSGKQASCSFRRTDGPGAA